MFYMYINIRCSNIHPLYKTEKGATVILCLVLYFWFNKHINHEKYTPLYKLVFLQVPCVLGPSLTTLPLKDLFSSHVVKGGGGGGGLKCIIFK
jgi:hypothetical protein